MSLINQSIAQLILINRRPKQFYLPRKQIHVRGQVNERAGENSAEDLSHRENGSK